MIPARTSVSLANGIKRRESKALRFYQDETGSGSPVEFALLLPLFLILLVGVFQVWEVISVKESLDRGVLQAAEYWSTCLPKSGGASTHCRHAASVLIRRELAYNSIIRSRAEAGQVEATDLVISYIQQPMEILAGGVPIVATPRPGSDPDDWPVFHPFLIQARLAMPWAVQVPFLPPLRIVVRAQHVAFKEKPYEQPTPTPASAVGGMGWGGSPTPTIERWGSTWRATPTPTLSKWDNT